MPLIRALVTATSSRTSARHAQVVADLWLASSGRGRKLHLGAPDETAGLVRLSVATDIGLRGDNTLRRAAAMAEGTKVAAAVPTFELLIASVRDFARRAAVSAASAAKSRESQTAITHARHGVNATGSAELDNFGPGLAGRVPPVPNPLELVAVLSHSATLKLIHCAVTDARERAITAIQQVNHGTEILDGDEYADAAVRKRASLPVETLGGVLALEMPDLRLLAPVVYALQDTAVNAAATVGSASTSTAVGAISRRLGGRRAPRESALSAAPNGERQVLPPHYAGAVSVLAAILLAAAARREFGIAASAWNACVAAWEASTGSASTRTETLPSCVTPAFNTWVSALLSSHKNAEANAVLDSALGLDSSRRAAVPSASFASSVASSLSAPRGPLRPDSQTLMVALYGADAVGDVRRADELWASLAHSVNLDAGARNAYMLALARSGRRAAAFHAFEAWQRVTAASGEGNLKGTDAHVPNVAAVPRAHEPNAETYAALILAAGYGSQTQQALSVWDDFVAAGGVHWPYASTAAVTLLQVAAAADGGRDALDVVDEAVAAVTAAGLFPIADDTESVASNVVLKTASPRDFQRRVQPCHPTPVYSALLHAARGAGDLSRSLTWLQQWRRAVGLCSLVPQRLESAPRATPPFPLHIYASALATASRAASSAASAAAHADVVDENAGDDVNDTASTLAAKLAATVTSAESIFDMMLRDAANWEALNHSASRADFGDTSKEFPVSPLRLLPSPLDRLNMQSSAQVAGANVDSPALRPLVDLLTTCALAGDALRYISLLDKAKAGGWLAGWTPAGRTHDNSRPGPHGRGDLVPLTSDAADLVVDGGCGATLNLHDQQLPQVPLPMALYVPLIRCAAIVRSPEVARDGQRASAEVGAELASALLAEFRAERSGGDGTSASSSLMPQPPPPQTSLACGVAARAAIAAAADSCDASGALQLFADMYTIDGVGADASAVSALLSAVVGGGDSRDARNALKALATVGLAGTDGGLAPLLDVGDGDDRRGMPPRRVLAVLYSAAEALAASVDTDGEVSDAHAAGTVSPRPLASVAFPLLPASSDPTATALSAGARGLGSAARGYGTQDGGVELLGLARRQRTLRARARAQRRAMEAGGNGDGDAAGAELNQGAGLNEDADVDDSADALSGTSRAQLLQLPSSTGLSPADAAAAREMRRSARSFIERRAWAAGAPSFLPGVVPDTAPTPSLRVRAAPSELANTAEFTARAEFTVPIPRGLRASKEAQARASPRRRLGGVRWDAEDEARASLVQLGHPAAVAATLDAAAAAVNTDGGGDDDASDAAYILLQHGIRAAAAPSRVVARQPGRAPLVSATERGAKRRIAAVVAATAAANSVSASSPSTISSDETARQQRRASGSSGSSRHQRRRSSSHVDAAAPNANSQYADTASEVEGLRGTEEGEDDAHAAALRTALRVRNVLTQRTHAQKVSDAACDIALLLYGDEDALLVDVDVDIRADTPGTSWWRAIVETPEVAGAEGATDVNDSYDDNDHDEDGTNSRSIARAAHGLPGWVHAGGGAFSFDIGGDGDEGEDDGGDHGTTSPTHHARAMQMPPVTAKVRGAKAFARGASARYRRSDWGATNE